MPREGQNLLEALESQQIEIDYQCREGFCGACQVDLVDGEVSYDQEPVAFVPAGRVLPCCCRATSDITIEIPESQRKTG